MSDRERRARLATRHALVPGQQADSPEAATQAVTALHATEAPTAYLSCWARVPGVTVADVDRALYADRTWRSPGLTDGWGVGIMPRWRSRSRWG